MTKPLLGSDADAAVAEGLDYDDHSTVDVQY
jgi:hypothetical protein